MDEQRATHNSWRCLPMPATKVSMQVSQTFTAEEYQRMQMGVIPHDMDDRWFIYFEDGWFFFHRSWTGFCIYQMRLEPDNAGWHIAEAWANADPDQFKSPENTSLFLGTINLVLLGKRP